MKRFTYALIVAGLILLAGAVLAQDDDDVSNLSFVVLKDYSGKPIRNASVVMHAVSKKGKQGRGDLELKADADGKCNFDGIPYGKLRVQVLAPGFQTFGQDYDIDKPNMVITVRLKRPQEQFSIYTDKQNDTKDDKKDDKSQTPDSNSKPK